jgi:phosphotransferase system  glucose/maltose/N-acetylglucosamine-specific IIC component
MGIFVFWLIFAILVGVYASNKGRSGIGFFLLAVITSPLIGFIIALVVSPNTKVAEEKALSSGEMKKCPHCAELVKVEATICKHCQSELGE